MRAKRVRLIRTEEIQDEIFNFARTQYERRFSGLLEIRPSEVPINFEGKKFRKGVKGKQYLADDLLREGDELKDDDIAIIITSEDIYTRGTTYIFGLATLNVGLVSFARIDPKFWDFVPEIYIYSEKDKEFFLRQFRKVLLHELGHALSLGHCQQPECVMRYSNSPFELYSKGEDYCGRCWNRLTSFTK